MAINKKLIHFESFTNFNSKKLSANKENNAYTLGISEEISSGEPDILYQSIVYIKDTKQQWTHGQLYNCGLSEEDITPIINKSLFVGTQSEYDAVSSSIAIGAIVIITDQDPINTGVFSAKLGSAVLGKLILGKV